MIDCEDRKFGIAAFDLIVVDECHRSIYNKYRAIFHYFDALILGLTATPREQVDASTYDAFELPDGEPTFSYDLETAVHEGYLVNFHPFERTTKLLKNGLKYAELSEDEKKEYEAAFGLIGDIPEEISNKLFYEQIINTDTIDLVWNCLMTEGLRVDSGERLGKSVVFAVNHRHAQAIVEEFKKQYPELGDDYCQLIDNQVKYADDIIEKFKVPDGNPIIAVSVDMLDTGIDVPEILNLVFFKRVYSKIKFWQMLGRGTRTCRNLNVVSPRKNFFAGAGTETVVDENGVDNCTDKQGFYVFDFCDVFEFFGAHPDGKTAKSVKSISQKIFDCKTEIVKELQGFEHQENEDHKKYYLQYRDELHTKVKNLNRHLVNVRSALKMVDKYSLGESWQSLSALGVKEIQTFISPLMDTDGADEMTAAFDLWLFNMELTEIIGEKDYTKAIDSVVAICNLLLQKLTVPAVAARKEHLIDFVKAEYWVNRTIDKLERVRIQVRDLLKYLDRGPVLNLVTGFEDTLIEKQGGHIPVTPDFRNYKQKVLDYLIEHSDSPVLEKIKTLQPITVEEVKELEDILFNKLGTRDDFNRYAKDMSVGAFIRQLIGLDNEAINKLLFEWENKYQFNSA
ncbi:MAG: DEAD/DEAH box helicase family protein, partial [Clostridia bacterium]|nr:DEAD/DEAH box helicase family protein [Clostridia bacterium]